MFPLGEMNVVPVFPLLMGEGDPDGRDECFVGVSVVNG